MPLIITPSTMGNGPGVEIDPALVSTARHAMGWSRSLTAGTTPSTRILTCQNTQDIPSAAEAAQLGENEYLACEREQGKTAFFLTDGYILFRPGEADTHVGRYPDQEAIPLQAFEAALFRALLDQQVLLLHALVFEYQGAGFMALGESGAGKTTLALAALAAGARIVSDDRVAIRAEDDTVMAYGMRPYLQIRPDSLRCVENSSVLTALDFPEAVTTVTRLGRARLPGHFVDCSPIDHMLLLQPARDRQRPASGSMAPATAAESLAATMAASLPYLFSMKPASLAADPYDLPTRLLSTTHMTRLTTGQDLMNHPAEVFTRLLHELRHATR